jgi:hypothetical protein
MSAKLASIPESYPVRPRRVVAVVVVGLPLLSLLATREPTPDALAWLIWGRELLHGTLSTTGGPSWKPLPVLLTTPFAAAGGTVAPWLWLLVARAAGLTAIVLAYLLARRLGGRLAGVLAAVGLALATDFLLNAVRGDSEGLLVALVFAAVLAHLDGRHRLAFAAGAAAALLRPEVWLLWGLYGLWLIHHERRWSVGAAVVASGILVLAAWLVPEQVGSGAVFRSAARAQLHVLGTPGASGFPFLMTFVKGAGMLAVPLYAGAVYAVVRAWRTRDRVVPAIAAGASVVMVTVAALAQDDFTGSLRYVTLPGALVCVLGGLGLPGLAGALSARRRLGPAAAVVAAVSVLVALGVLGAGAVRVVHAEILDGHQLPRLIARAGGAARIRACGPLSANGRERQAVAWDLGVSQRAILTRPLTRGTLLATTNSPLWRSSPLPMRDRLGGWVRRARCQ